MDHRTHLQSALGTAYTLEQELGGGGMSRVYVAEETSLGRKVVVKVLPPELMAGVNVDRFKREIQLAARLQQAQIVPVLAAGEVDGVPWYTMPFVEGESLRSRLARDGALPIPEVTGILRDVARALAYAHDRGIVHRDIKPDNVLLSGGSAVVMDFGIAKAISAARASSTDTALTQLGTSVGTPAYMSPEQAAGDPDVDHRADIYSFGCMAYELLAGQPPFPGRSPQRAIAAHITETPRPVAELRPDTPPALAELVMRCLEKDAAARPQRAGEVLAALEAATSGTGAQSVPALLLSGPRAMQRGFLAYAVAFVVVAVLAKAAVVGFGLPDLVFTGALVLMGVGFPMVAATAWAHHTARRVATRTPVVTGGGSPVPHGTLTAMALKASRHLTWKRTFRLGALAVGGFALAIVAVMVLRGFGLGPFASLMAAGTMDEQERLLVVDVDAGADTALSHVVTEAVRTNLGQSRVVSIMPPAAIAAALRRMERPPATRLDAALAREIALREGAKAVVDGSITKLGDGFILSLRLVSADSGRSLATFQETADGPGELLETIDELTRKLRGRIGESLKEVRDAPALERVTTGSLEALQKYAQAVRTSDLEGDYAKTATLLREAVALDPEFAMAYRKLGVTLNNLGMPQPQIDSALGKAYEHRVRLTEKERHLAVATYYYLSSERDRQKAEQGYRQALAVDPGDATSLINLASLLRSRRDHAGAESLYAVLFATGRAPQAALGNYASALFNSGKLTQAESVYRELARRAPTSTAAQLYPTFFWYQRGQLDSLDRFWRARLRDPNPIIRVGAASSLSNQALLRGQIREAQALLRDAMALNAARGVPANPLADSLTSAAVQIWFLGNDERGVGILDGALARTPMRSLPVEQRPYFAAAMYYAWAGRADRARAVLAQYDAEVRDSSMRALLEPSRHAALAEIALAEARPEDAVREWWKADSLPDGPSSDCGHCVHANLGRAWDAAGKPDSAIAAWERFLDAPYAGRASQDASYLAGLRKRLGELYAAKGDRARAIANFEAFVELWKDADPELQPQVREVRERLEVLRASGSG